MQFGIDSNQLLTEGYCTLTVLNPVQIQSLLDFFVGFQDIYSEDKGAFQSTMLVNDPEHRRAVDEKIKACIEEQIETIVPGYEILFSNFLMKNPKEESSVGIHTDWSYVEEPEFKSYNLWIPLVNVDEENGCLHVWPKSQLITPSVRPTPYVPFKREEERKVILHSRPVELTAGQGILYHSGLIHYSNPNYSESPRPAIAMVLKPKGSKAIHYFLEAENRIRKYSVDKDFFLTHKPGQEPLDANYDSSLDIDSFSLLDALETKYSNNASHVAQYYNEWSDAYQDVYGDVIQAFRPTNETELLNYVIKSTKMQEGQSILDAGCGTCGPAVHFARKAQVKIEGITVSESQVVQSLDRIKNAGLEDEITCRAADFHFMKGVKEKSKDGVLFLETLGHSSDPAIALDSAYDVLKDDGFVYIKDFFSRKSNTPETALRINKSVENINKAYQYNVLKLSEVLAILGRTGFVIDFVRRFDFESDTKVRAEFESRFDISVFHQGEFELAEWLEIRAIKHFSENDR